MYPSAFSQYLSSHLSLFIFYYKQNAANYKKKNGKESAAQVRQANESMSQWLFREFFFRSGNAASQREMVQVLSLPSFKDWGGMHG